MFLKTFKHFQDYSSIIEKNECSVVWGSHLSGFTWAACRCMDHYENRRTKTNQQNWTPIYKEVVIIEAVCWYDNKASVGVVLTAGPGWGGCWGCHPAVGPGPKCGCWTWAVWTEEKQNYAVPPCSSARQCSRGWCGGGTAESCSKENNTYRIMCFF